MKDGLDLSKFKKVSSDKNVTILRHDGGHEIKIAHNVLSKKMKDQLDKLPMYAADGADVDDGSDENEAAAPTVAPAAAPQDMDNSSPAPAPTEDEAEEPKESDSDNDEADEADEAPNIPPPQPGEGPAPLLTPPLQLSQDLKTHDAQWANDLANGHVKPETYADLLAKKDTLGKIGTIFGMLLSGMGSGLAHQSNAAMDMMNKQIQNDLEAQKQSKENAMNFIRLNQQNEMNKAQVHRMGVENGYTQSQMDALKAKTPAELAEIASRVRENDAKIANAKDLLPAQKAEYFASAGAKNTESKIQSDALAHMQANRVAVHDLTMKMNALPEGSPQRLQAQQALGLLTQGVDAQNSNIADKAAGLQALNVSMNPAGAQTTASTDPASAEQAFQAQNRFLKLASPQTAKIAEDNEEKHMPGLPGAASMPLTSDDRNTIQTGQNFVQSLSRLKDFVKQNGNSLDPKVIAAGKALAAQVQGDFRMATHGGVYKEGEQNFIDKIIPSNPAEFLPSVRVLPKINSVLAETKARTNNFVKSKGFPGMPDASPPSQVAQTPSTKTVKGVQYTKGPNGEAIPVPKTAKK